MSPEINKLYTVIEYIRIFSNRHILWKFTTGSWLFVLRIFKKKKYKKYNTLCVVQNNKLKLNVMSNYFNYQIVNFKGI